MNYPDNQTMLTLMAIDQIEGFILWPDGRMSIRFCGMETIVTGDQIDELESRGWIDLGEDRVSITRDGKYWAERWAKKNHGKMHTMKMLEVRRKPKVTA